MKSRFFILLILFCNVEFIFAQKEGNIWFFGSGAGVDFNTGTPVALTNSNMVAEGGCATISDLNGHLLFYTNGQIVYNRKNAIMANGTGLLGGISSTQSALIIPLPGSANLYYVFTVFQFGVIWGGFRYSIVDMNQDSGKGSVIIKNILILTPTCEKISAVRHSDNRSLWVVTHLFNSDSFFSYLLTPSGFNSTPIISRCGSYHGGVFQNARGYMKFSPDGKTLALGTQNFSEMFDFNTTTGAVSNPIQLKYNSNPVAGYGVEFSPDGSKLYLFSGKIYQFD